MGFTAGKSKSSNKDVIFSNETIRGIVDFSRVHEPKAKYGKDKSKFDNDKEYSLSLRMDDAETLKQFNTILKKYNFSDTVLHPGLGKQVPRVRPDKDGTLRVQFKRNYVTEEGKINRIPVMLSDGKTALPPTSLVGNGSEAVVYLTISQDAATGEGKSMLLAGLQVLNLASPNGPKFMNLSQSTTENTTSDDDDISAVF